MAIHRIAVVLCAIAPGALFNIAHADVIHRRGGETSITGEVSAIDEAGVTIRRKDLQPEFIRWDRVREVQTDQPRPELERYWDDAVRLWRARSRLERGDFELAQPLFERLFEKYRGQKHETALVVAEGLLRCRLARGNNDSAVIPALESIRLRRSLSSAATVYSILRPVIDVRTSLCVELPPAWVALNALVKLERELGSYDAQGDPVVAAQAALYRLAIQQQMGIAPSAPRELAGTDPGVAFLRLLVQASSADVAKREASRKELQQLLPKLEPWESSWAYFALGMSWLQEPEIAEHERGMVLLAHLPASAGQSQPYLTGLAIAELARACDRTGDPAAAAALRADLKLTYGSHPVVSRLPAAPAGSATQPATRTEKEPS